MRVRRGSSIVAVAFIVGDALDRHGIDAVLTGGGCAGVHSQGGYVSADLDFILRRLPTQELLDLAMATQGFKREQDRYVHDRSDIFVEFPVGPLAIGEDLHIRPIRRRQQKLQLRLLSATDSCRDRLAAFYHWGDRQALAVALEIARLNRVDLAKIRAWSAAEGAAEGFEEFQAQRRRLAASKRKSRRGSLGR